MLSATTALCRVVCAGTVMVSGVGERLADARLVARGVMGLGQGGRLDGDGGDGGRGGGSPAPRARPGVVGDDGAVGQGRAGVGVIRGAGGVPDDQAAAGGDVGRTGRARGEVHDELTGAGVPADGVVDVLRQQQAAQPDAGDHRGVAPHAHRQGVGDHVLVGGAVAGVGDGQGVVDRLASHHRAAGVVGLGEGQVRSGGGDGGGGGGAVVNPSRVGISPSEVGAVGEGGPGGHRRAARVVGADVHVEAQLHHLGGAGVVGVVADGPGQGGRPVEGQRPAPPLPRPAGCRPRRWRSCPRPGRRRCCR